MFRSTIKTLIGTRLRKNNNKSRTPKVCLKYLLSVARSHWHHMQSSNKVCTHVLVISFKPCSRKAHRRRYKKPRQCQEMCQVSCSCMSASPLTSLQGKSGCYSTICCAGVMMHFLSLLLHFLPSSNFQWQLQIVLGLTEPTLPLFED